MKNKNWYRGKLRQIGLWLQQDTHNTPYRDSQMCVLSLKDKAVSYNIRTEFSESTCLHKELCWNRNKTDGAQNWAQEKREKTNPIS